MHIKKYSTYFFHNIKNTFFKELEVNPIKKNESENFHEYARF